ncbi:MAG TPA: hypothetical protein VFL12_12125 [Thermoanaerobaculia bacterium]|nr:hypothetical protein [Thermoanaerobaculia bacterium]
MAKAMPEASSSHGNAAGESAPPQPHGGVNLAVRMSIRPARRMNCQKSRAVARTICKIRDATPGLIFQQPASFGAPK